MNDVALQSNGPLGALSRFFPALPTNDLGAGIQASFAIVGYKGKVWSLRYRGDNKPIMRPDGDGPAASIELVIIKAPIHLSKIYYETGYVEGSNAPPDCFSNDAVKPDPTAKKIQNPVCATCKWNAWGSRIVQQAGRTSAGKACSDSKRLAVVPLQNLRNEDLGGPMLLRVPPASLQDLALYGSALAKYSYPYYAVATRVSFDVKEAYPKFLFQAIRALTDDEAQIIIELQRSDAIERVLAETGEGAEAQDVVPPAQASPFEQAPQPKPQPQPPFQSAPQPSVQQPQPAPQPNVVQSQPAPQPNGPQPTQEQIAEYLARQQAQAIPGVVAQQEPQIRANPENREAPADEFEQQLDQHLAALLPQ